LLLSLLLGFITGYLISIPPVGPTNIAIMSKGFDKDIKSGVAMGAGAGFIDMVYILIAFGGVAAFLSFLPYSVKTFFIENESSLIASLTFFGCFIVVFYGIKILKTKVLGNSENNEFKEAYLKTQSTLRRKGKNLDKILHTKTFEKKRSRITESFIAGSLFCLSSITLPASWFIIVGYFKSYGIIDTSFLSGFSLAFGVLIGTTLWFYTLVKIVSSKSHKVRPQTLSKLNLGVGIILLLLGVFLFYKAFDFALS
jgi:threonine/homoserine/homoserine lactone efflux protein